MKFNDYVYKRPDLEAYKEKFNNLLLQFNDASSVEQQIETIKLINALRNDFETMSTIASINFTRNTTDKFFEKEHNFFDENKPIVDGLIFDYYKSLTNSVFKSELFSEFGEQLFNIANATLKAFSPQIVPDLQESNKFVSQYVKLLSSAKINFEGKTINISGMAPYSTSTDREIRRKAAIAKWGFFENNSKELDEIYDKLVKVRTKMARKLGYENYTDMAYAKLYRTDYDKTDVGKFRNHVLKYIVPIATKLKYKQMERAGIDNPKYYDYDLIFKTGNAKPKGNPEWIVERAREMYAQLSEETNLFMDTMIENNLMDLYNKEGKAPGGYCTFIPEYKTPFIFANMNGTSDDIRVLTHEAGHAFQAFSSRNFSVPEYVFPTLESAEIHSMSMEFITWPWMKLFFNGETEKFKTGHLEKSILFIPYGVTVDEFQHIIYENPDMTPSERNQAWRETERKYLPWKDYDENFYLNNGGYWQSQPHIYRMPFYYIDYCLAMICALQFLIKSNKDRSKAWNEYLALCRAGGSKSFKELLKLGNLNSPFEESSISSVINEISNWIENHTGSNL